MREEVLLKRPLTVKTNECGISTLRIHSKGWPALAMTIIFCLPFFLSVPLTLYLILTASTYQDWINVSLFSVIFLFPSLIGIYILLIHVLDSVDGRTVVLDDANQALLIKNYGKTRRIKYADIQSFEIRSRPYLRGIALGDILLNVGPNGERIFIFRTLGVSGTSEESIRGKLEPILSWLQSHCHSCTHEI